MTMTVFEIARVLSAMASGLFLIGLITFAIDHPHHWQGYQSHQQIDRPNDPKRNRG